MMAGDVARGPVAGMKVLAQVGGVSVEEASTGRMRGLRMSAGRGIVIGDVVEVV